MYDYIIVILLLLLPFFILPTTSDQFDAPDNCKKVNPSLRNTTRYNCAKGSNSICLLNVLSYEESDRANEPIQRKPSRRFHISAKLLESTGAWCAKDAPTTGHFKEENNAYLDDHLPLFVNMVWKWDQESQCSMQNATTIVPTATKPLVTEYANSTSSMTESTRKATTNPTRKATMKPSSKIITTGSTRKTTPAPPCTKKRTCKPEWRSVVAVNFLDVYKYGHKREDGVDVVDDVKVWNWAVRVGFLCKPAEMEEAPLEFKQLRESVNKAMSRKHIMKAEFIKQKLDKSSARDLKETVDYDYMNIPVEKDTKKNARIVVQVLVHECDGAVFVSAAWRRKDMKENPETLDWSKDLSYLNYCCYDRHPIFTHEFNTKETISQKYWPDHMDATIENVTFGYEFPNKPLTREQKIAVMYKYGFSLAKRPRYRNRWATKASKWLPWTDGLFIAPPKLTVESPEQHTVNVKFSWVPLMEWDDITWVQIRQWAIRCDCTDAKEGRNSLMRNLTMYVPRIYAAVIDKVSEERKAKTVDIIKAVEVDKRGLVYEDDKRGELILYEEKEWKDA